jgi:hypothetical protein
MLSCCGDSASILTIPPDSVIDLFMLFAVSLLIPLLRAIGIRESH